MDFAARCLMQLIKLSLYQAFIYLKRNGHQTEITNLSRHPFLRCASTVVREFAVTSLSITLRVLAFGFV